ncbi:MAG: STAS domain-containing protein [Candidatus Omnitrophica bacterium]|nr:STAS domain-containing protein [Candidatus Omnitrophota bacterium]
MKYFSNEQTGDITVVRFRFNMVDLRQREELKKDLAGLLESGNRKFIFNMSEIGFLSSLMIATIIFFAKDVRSGQGDVKLCELSDEARNVFRITRLDRVMEAYDTERQAMESFGG